MSSQIVCKEHNNGERSILQLFFFRKKQAEQMKPNFIL